jgi:restriction system protein
MARRRESAVESLVLLPWWVSLFLAGIVYIFLPELASVPTKDLGFRMILSAARYVAPYLAAGLVLISLVSAMRAWANSRMLDNQTGLDSLLGLPWKQFEDLVAEAYRREGYAVEETLGGGADGGVDLILYRGGKTTVVQCKRWTGKPVRVEVVRELYGVMTHQRADAAKLVATTTFTADALNFARGKRIELIDKNALLKLLRGVQHSAKIAPVQSDDAPHCPRCKSNMVKRTARRGANAGRSFWGCVHYPTCKGIRDGG